MSSVNTLPPPSMAKRGRPKKYKEFVYFGMKVTPEEKQMIKRLAELQGTSASDVVVSLVKEKIKAFENFSVNLKPTEILALSPKKREQYMNSKINPHEVYYGEDDILDVVDDIIEYENDL